MNGSERDQSEQGVWCATGDSRQATQSSSSSSCGNPLVRLLRFVWLLPGYSLIGVTRLYQIAVSPLLGPTCRFRPTCSEYFLQSVRKYGAVRGSLRGARRILRCHPWNPGGFDPP